MIVKLDNEQLTTDSISQRVASLATRRLTATGIRTLSTVSCDFHEGVLILWGRVPSYYMKQIAQTAVRGLTQVERIDNRLEVDSHWPTQERRPS